MRWKNVRLIFAREVRDQMRDRRTLFMIAVLPLLLYPALGIGMVQMTLWFAEQPRTVVILGDEHLPDVPLVDGRYFDAELFRGGQFDAEKLEVLTESRLIERRREAADGAGKEQHDLLARARLIQRKVAEREQIEDPTKLAALNEELSTLFARSGMQVLIIIPEDFRDHIERVNRQIGVPAEAGELTGPVKYPRPLIVKNRADEGSGIAYAGVKEAMDAWEERILQKRLAEANLPNTFSSPVNVEPVDLAQPQQLSASVWSRLFPALLVIMSVTGAFYPAVDLAAGEKERGTMETLLICPASRTEIVLGKFFTVMLFSMSTALLNLMSMGLTGKYLSSMAAGGAMAKVGGLSPPSFGAIGWVLLLLVPLAALFSALCLSLATFARSSKEGQYYLTPLLMVTLGLTVFCLSPGITIDPLRSVLPVVGPALLLKELLSSNAGSSALGYVLPVMLTSVGYSLLALWWAIEQFSREDVLFREAERFELGLWMKHLLRDKESTPTFAEAGFCFVTIVLLQFAAIRLLQGPLVDAPAGDRGNLMIRLLMVQQVALIASPALIMGVILTTDFLKTFRLRRPQWGMLGLAAALPPVLHPLTLEFSAVMQQWFFRIPLPPSIVEQLQAMTSADRPLWLVLLAFAVTPAICEELAFRGFILSGFRRSRHVWLAIVLSALTFGIIHMIPQQVFNATLLGIVLGLIAVRGNSLWPCMLFHVMYNGLEIVRGRLGAVEPAWLMSEPVEWFVRSGEGGIRYEWPTLVLAACVAVVLLRRLVVREDEGRVAGGLTERGLGTASSARVV